MLEMLKIWKGLFFCKCHTKIVPFVLQWNGSHPQVCITPTVLRPKQPSLVLCPLFSSLYRHTYSYPTLRHSGLR